MNNLELYIKNDTTKIVTNDDTLTYLCAEHQECNNQYKDFKFITESSGKWNGPQQRDVSFVSAGWNFTILFVVMMIVVSLLPWPGSKCALCLDGAAISVCRGYLLSD